MVLKIRFIDVKAEGKGILHHKEHELILVKRWRENDSYGNIFVLGCLWQIYRNNRTLVFMQIQIGLCFVHW